MSPQTIPQQIITILLCTAATMTTRFLPFVLFGRSEHVPPVITYLGKALPSAVFAMLVVYCYCSYFQGRTLSETHYGLAEFAAGAVVVLLQLWRRNPLLSILAGTVVYMVLIQKVLC